MTNYLFGCRHFDSGKLIQALRVQAGKQNHQLYQTNIQVFGV